jgi:hypothetical protein
MTKSLYLLADSQLLFWKENELPFASRFRKDMEANHTGAAYIGASNGDDPQFYEIFLSAMELIGLSQCRMIPARPSSEDMKFLDEAGLVLLSGGNVENGWRTLEQNGVKDMIVRKRYDGIVIVGISAGAVQLGLGALTESPHPQKLDMFRFAPFYLGAHEEHEEWWDLRALVNLSPREARGIGIPAGAGAVYHPDGTSEPVRKSLVEFFMEDGQMRESLLLPPSAGINSEPGS